MISPYRPVPGYAPTYRPMAAPMAMPPAYAPQPAAYAVARPGAALFGNGWDELGALALTAVASPIAAVAGAGLGFMIAGPIGAARGAVLGASVLGVGSAIGSVINYVQTRRNGTSNGTPLNTKFIAVELAIPVVATLGAVIAHASMGAAAAAWTGIAIAALPITVVWGGIMIAKLITPPTYYPPATPVPAPTAYRPR